MNVLVDSYGWIEFFGSGPLKEKYRPIIAKASPEHYFTPSIVLFEVFKKIRAECDENAALKVFAYISAYTSIIDLDKKIAVDAAEISLATGLSMADAVIKATAEARNCTIYTSDRHFRKIDGTIFIG